MSARADASHDFPSLEYTSFPAMEAVDRVKLAALYSCTMRKTMLPVVSDIRSLKGASCHSDGSYEEYHMRHTSAYVWLTRVFALALDERGDGTRSFWLLAVALSRAPVVLYLSTLYTASECE